jgi:hypothetical protein
MAKMPLTSGAYTARSLVANAQRCVNLYGEKNPDDSPFPFTYYPTPGLTLLANAGAPAVGASGWRCLYYASNNQLYGVFANIVYAISNTWSLTQLGTISSSSGQCWMTDNHTDLVLVDGSANGWSIHLANNAFAAIAQAAFVGSTSANFADGWLIFNSPNTQQWYISLNNQLTFDPTFFASKSGAQDLLVAAAVAKRYVYLLGQQTIEVWFDAGDTPFPYDRLPGVFMQHGCMSAASVSQMDGDIYWLGQNTQGKAMVMRSEQFNALQISTYAVDDAIQQYTDLNQAIGFTYQIEGHMFYVLTFPVTDKTWQYDLSNNQWNELAWLDSNGQFHRHRAGCYANAYNTPVVGDWQNGNLYMWDINNYTDNGAPITRIRSFPHGVDDSSSRIHYVEFIASMEVGDGNGSNTDNPVSLRWSDTRGKSWGNPVMRSLGKEGEYLTSVQWRRLGMARDRVFELSWSAPCKTALLGAWVDAHSNNQ